MKIFISYRRADSKYVVDRIRDRLIAAYDDNAVFRDIESIPLGQNFSDVLNEATSTCNVMLVVIGPQWAGITDAQGNKRLFDLGDYTRIEIETGLAHKEILVIPVLVMNAPMPGLKDIPESLADLLMRNAISVRNDPDFNQDMIRLVQGINESVGAPPITVQDFEPETVYVPAGPFLMGDNSGKGKSDHEKPHEITLQEYRIGKYPVTNAQYETFVRATTRTISPEMGWDGRKVPTGAEKLPVAGVTFFDAVAYCKWLSEKTNRKYTLPNEAQWEKASRGGNQTVYPWGDDFDPARCNHGRTTVSPVDAYPAQNDYGCFDFVGNVRQWTCTLWGGKRLAPDPMFASPWKDDIGRNDLNAGTDIRRVVRGSTMEEDAWQHRCSARSGQVPDDPGSRISFRVVMTV